MERFRKSLSFEFQVRCSVHAGRNRAFGEDAHRFREKRDKNRGRPFSVMAHLKTSIGEVKAQENCLAHSLVISIAKVENDSDYKTYRQGRKIRQVVQTLLETTDIDLSNGAGIPELVRFQEHFREYKIVVYRGLS